jgi:phage portal protein BeeE
MSPLTPVMRDVQGDDGLTTYKVKYLANNATPNVYVKYAQKLQPATVDSIRERMNARYGGPDNAGKGIILDQGADITLVGNSLSQMDFSGVSAVGTERILAACEVPGVLVGLEPLRGAGRGYQESMQKFANIWARPAWRSVCGALGQIADVPAGNRLWFDTSDIAALQDGEMERGQTSLVRAQALLSLVQAGFTHESAVAAVDAADLSQLKAAPVALPPPNSPVQNMLHQAQPGAVAAPVPPGQPRLDVGPVSPHGGESTRPMPRIPSSVRRALEDANGRV